MTPFVVTTKRDDGPKLGWIVGVPSISRVAVATLEDRAAPELEDSDDERRSKLGARSLTLDAVIEACIGQPPGSCVEFSQAAMHLPESGGTVGPLPDGTTVKVEPIDWHDIWQLAGQPDFDDMHDPASRAEIIDAFNTREEGS